MLFSLTTKVYAEANGSSAFDTLLTSIVEEIVSPIIYFLIALALIYFLWGIFIFVKNADNPDKRSEGYDHMIWGIIGLFIIIAANGIINAIMSTLTVSL
jgi:uncharacterized membrane protein YidH (DUF202 family)